jgi:hypothetical protein
MPRLQPDKLGTLWARQVADLPLSQQLKKPNHAVTDRQNTHHYSAGMTYNRIREHSVTA